MPNNVSPTRSPLPLDVRDRVDELMEVANERAAQRLKHMRKFRGMTQTQLAAQMGCSFQQLQKYETGMNRISIGRMEAAAAALRVSMADMLEFENRPANTSEMRLIAAFRAMDEPVRSAFLRVGIGASQMAELLGDEK